VHKGIGALGFAGFIIVALLIGWVSGRFGQRIFDDEVLGLAAIEANSYGGLIKFYLAGRDVHPPLPFLWLRFWSDMAAPIWLQRVLALALVSAGFALVLDLVWRRLPPQARASRWLAVVLFLGAPLLYGMGASLRWYPLLVLPVAFALWSALQAGRPTLGSAFGFGLAANISFVAAIPAAAYLIWRYLFRQSFDPKRDGVFLALTALIALPALVAFFQSTGNLALQLDSHVLAALGTTALGLLGGYGLGLTQGLIAIPIALLMAIGLIGAVTGWRRVPGQDLVVIALLMLVFCLALACAGFAKPRALLFAVPFLLAAVALGSALPVWRRWHAVATGIAALSVTFPALFLLNANDRPFKRNLYIADAEVLRAIGQHAPKETSLIVSSEPSLAWRLQLEGYCVINPSLATGCQRKTAPVVVLIDDGTFTLRPGLSAGAFAPLTGHRLIHQQLFGDDEDGPTKTFLTGRLVPKFLISVAVYRRD
jgi:hypothetical protein